MRPSQVCGGVGETRAEHGGDPRRAQMPGVCESCACGLRGDGCAVSPRFYSIVSNDFAPASPALLPPGSLGRVSRAEPVSLPPGQARRLAESLRLDRTSSLAP